MRAPVCVCVCVVCVSEGDRGGQGENSIQSHDKSDGLPEGFLKTKFVPQLKFWYFIGENLKKNWLKFEK